MCTVILVPLKGTIIIYEQLFSFGVFFFLFLMNINAVLFLILLLFIFKEILYESRQKEHVQLIINIVYSGSRLCHHWKKTDERRKIGSLTYIVITRYIVDSFLHLCGFVQKMSKRFVTVCLRGMKPWQFCSQPCRENCSWWLIMHSG